MYREIDGERARESERAREGERESEREKERSKYVCKQPTIRTLPSVTNHCQVYQYACPPTHHQPTYSPTHATHPPTHTTPTNISTVHVHRGGIGRTIYSTPPSYSSGDTTNYILNTNSIITTNYILNTNYILKTRYILNSGKLLMRRRHHSPKQKPN